MVKRHDVQEHVCLWCRKITKFGTYIKVFLFLKRNMEPSNSSPGLFFFFFRRCWLSLNQLEISSWMTDVLRNTSISCWKCYGKYSFHCDPSWGGNWQPPQRFCLMSQTFSHLFQTPTFLRRAPAPSPSTWKFIPWSIVSRVDGIARWSCGKESACQCNRLRRFRESFTPGSGRSPGEGTGSPLQYCCLENPINRGAWWATVHGVTENPAQLK